MKNLIGREAEIKILHQALASNSAELVAIYGRRRVGKTHLIRTVYQKELILELTGINNAPFTEQIENFSLTIARTLKIPISRITPTSWLQAFYVLMDVLIGKTIV
jgi:AAA+ ATPase superfamily predicted ATPase